MLGAAVDWDVDGSGSADDMTTKLAVYSHFLILFFCCHNLILEY